MARAGIVSSFGLAAKRRYALVIVFVAAAILTPPDIISQIGLAIPIIILYEISIIAVRMVERKKAETEVEDEDDVIDETDFNN